MSEKTEASEDIELLRERVRELAEVVFRQPNPMADESLYQEYVAAVTAVTQAEQDMPPVVDSKTARPTETPHRGQLLGPDSDDLTVTTQVLMEQVPIGIYHVLDQETQPLVTVELKNESFEDRRLRVRTLIEGLSAESLKSVKLEANETRTLPFLPTLFPERTRFICQVQRATLQVQVDDLDDGKILSFNSHTLTLLARSSCIWRTRDASGEWRDLGHYFGAWITPHVPAVLQLLPKAAKKLEEGGLGLYRRDSNRVNEQVGALYNTLAEEGLTYVNSLLHFGLGQDDRGQRVRLPTESLRDKAANCLDGTLLLASLLEAATLRPAIAIYPGHALLAWEQPREGRRSYGYVETTMLGSHSFEAARQVGEQQAQDHQALMQVYEVAEIRRRGIWPME